MILYDLYKAWYDVKIKPSNRAKSTLEKYDKIGKLIGRYFPQDLEELKPSEYQMGFNEIGKRAGYDYAGRVNRAVKKSINFAKADDLDVRDVTLGIEIFTKRPKKPRAKKYLQSYSDYEAVTAALKARFNYDRSVSPYFLYLLFETGLRPAELMGLTWDDVDFDAASLIIDKAISTATLERARVKNDFSIRKIPLNETSVEVFEEIRMKQASMLTQHAMKNDENLVFWHWAYINNLPVNATMTKLLRKVLDELGIEPKISLYGARHSKLSVLLAKGIEMPVVAKYAGHSSNEQLIRTYGGLLAENEIEGFDKIRKI